MVERDHRGLMIGEQVPEQIRFGDVLKLVVICLLLERIPPLVERDHLLAPPL
jgi:hypothetical protein